MYCPKCGKENHDDAQVCSSCSEALTTASSQAPSQPPKTSGLAITSLVLGLLSFCTFLITALPAIICGIISLIKISKSQGRLKGQGLAIAGIVVPVASLPVIALLMAILMPALARVKSMSYQVVCGHNLKNLGIAMAVYAHDYPKGAYPTASRWCDLLIEGDYANKDYFICKGSCEGPGNYAMNKNIEKLGQAAPPGMVLLFETRAGWNQSGGPEILTTDNHRGDGCNVLFNDGYVEFVSTEDLGDLKWTAKQNE